MNKLELNPQAKRKQLIKAFKDSSFPGWMYCFNNASYKLPTKRPA